MTGTGFLFGGLLLLSIHDPHVFIDVRRTVVHQPLGRCVAIRGACPSPMPGGDQAKLRSQGLKKRVRQFLISSMRRRVIVNENQWKKKQ